MKFTTAFFMFSLLALICISYTEANEETDNEIVERIQKKFGQEAISKLLVNIFCNFLRRINLLTFNLDLEINKMKSSTSDSRDAKK